MCIHPHYSLQGGRSFFLTKMDDEHNEKKHEQKAEDEYTLVFETCISKNKLLEINRNVINS